MKTPQNRHHRAARSLGCLLLLLSLAGCNNSSNDDDNGSPPEMPPPETTPTSVELVDAMPANGSTQADPGINDTTFSYFGYSDFSLTLDGDCANGATLERSVSDLSVDFDALFEHNQVCEGLTDTGAYATVVDATRANGDAFEARHGFSTTTAMAPALQVQDSVSTARESVADMFQTFLDESLVEQLDLPDALASVLEAAVDAIADAAYGNLVNADAQFAVTAQRVAYASRAPDGSASGQLTGLIAFPDTSAAGFAPRDSIIVLSHSTGVTPSDLAVTDAWFVVANILASRGYLVIAPDNWGRGGTAAQPETFLMATRTAANSLDMIRAVLADPAYDEVRGSAPPQITIVGYSQGGHSALALWQSLATQAPDIGVPKVYAGAGPYNLYATTRGVVQHAAGTCNDDVYCRYATDETSVPYLSERVLPGYLAYSADTLTLANLVEGDSLTPAFVDGFLDNDPAYDELKGQLQQSSFTNITGGLDALNDSGTQFSLFHSEFDRLVPIANTEELATVLEGQFTVDVRTDACDSDAYQTIFDATDQVGISHALCGFEMLNDVYAEVQ